ncbi:transcriptional regulator [Pendulispora rubella]|uniref:Transcriptional regulator n=1 Tax=Pendulispora rubella TaxID=2741070 RepID=A0ABZ2KXR5_9BACT
MGGNEPKEHLADLQLASACARGEVEAITAFEAQYFREIDVALVRIARSTADRNEIAQRVRERFFVAPPGGPPRIAEYTGRGPLRNWARAGIVRVVLQYVTRRPRDVPTEDAVFLAGLTSNEPSPEVAYLRARYGAEFKASFERAANALTPRERNLLRHGILDGLTSDELGALFGVHRATAARWLASARERLIDELRKDLSARLNVPRAEVDSLLRIMQSNLEITLQRYLGNSDAEEESA